MASKLKLVEDVVETDKQKALSAALKQIDQAFGKGSVMRLGEKPAMEIEAISTGSLSLDIALGIGGLPKGRIVEIYGPESSGKTTLALHCIAEAQKSGGVCAFVDAEHALDPVYARKLGVDLVQSFRQCCANPACESCRQIRFVQLANSRDNLLPKLVVGYESFPAAKCSLPVFGHLLPTLRFNRVFDRVIFPVKSGNVKHQCQIVTGYSAVCWRFFFCAPNVYGRTEIPFRQCLDGWVGVAFTKLLRPEPKELVNQPLLGVFELLDRFANIVEARRRLHWERRALRMRVLPKFGKHL